MLFSNSPLKNWFEPKRRFGLLLLIFTLIFFYKFKDFNLFSYFYFPINIILIILIIKFPKFFKKPLDFWLKIGLLLQTFINPIIIGLIFFILITPLSFLMRCLGKDILGLKYHKSNSYWIKKSLSNKSLDDFKRQF
jgi:hypothetical protein